MLWFSVSGLEGLRASELEGLGFQGLRVQGLT